jgi:hypothetical protein
MNVWWLCAALVTGAGALGQTGRLLWPKTLDLHPAVLAPVWESAGDEARVTLRGRFLVAEVASYDDEYFAYLMRGYLSGVRTLQDTEVLLTYRRHDDKLTYPIQIRLPNDLLTSLPLLNEAGRRGLFPDYTWRFVDEDTLQRFRQQTHTLDTAYRLPAGRTMESLERSELAAYMRRFVQYKSATDPRVRAGMEPAPTPLDETAAHRLAGDIIAVADFYGLPLDFFLGIGAMENNYMNVTGDLDHAVWKRRAEKDDIVLERKGGRVLVRNQAAGVWQITRETLRYVHRLYLKDERDYSLLPERLTPPRELDFNAIDPEVLTTYAGLLFRNLLDRFEGDVATAVGAYNGGPGRPNAKYEVGVRSAANHARNVLEQAAAMHGRSAAGMHFMRSAD